MALAFVNISCHFQQVLVSSLKMNPWRPSHCEIFFRVKKIIPDNFHMIKKRCFQFIRILQNAVVGFVLLSPITRLKSGTIVWWCEDHQAIKQHKLYNFQPQCHGRVSYLHRGFTHCSGQIFRDFRLIPFHYTLHHPAHQFTSIKCFLQSVFTFKYLNK